MVTRDEGHRARRRRHRARARRAIASSSRSSSAFGVADGDYAVDIMRIKEIINPVPVTPMPKAPPFIEGVIELRGAILPLVDLRKRFDLPPPAPTRATKFLIVAIDRRRAAHRSSALDRRPRVGAAARAARRDQAGAAR